MLPCINIQIFNLIAFVTIDRKNGQNYWYFGTVTVLELPITTGHCTSQNQTHAVALHESVCLN